MGPYDLKKFIQNNVYAFLDYIFQQLMSLFTREHNIKRSFKMFIFIFIFLFFFLFYLPHNNYKKYLKRGRKKKKKKKWQGDLTETIGAYERLGLLETMS